MFCHQCGESVKEENKFCQNCGVSSDGIAPTISEAVVGTERLTGWRCAKYIFASFVLLALSISWIYELTSGDGSDDVWRLIMAVTFGLWGSALLARVFGKTLSGMIKDFFRLKAIKTSGGIVKKFLEFALWLGLIVFVIWLIVALGPLWIIAIILLFILFVLANR